MPRSPKSANLTCGVLMQQRKSGKIRSIKRSSDKSLRSRPGRRFAGGVRVQRRKVVYVLECVGSIGLRSVEPGAPRHSADAAKPRHSNSGRTTRQGQSLSRGCLRGDDASQGNQPQDGRLAYAGLERRFVRMSSPPRTAHIGLSACVRCGSCLRVV